VDKMPDIKMPKDKITDSGMTVKAVAEKSGILRETLYNRLKGVGEFTASEIVSLSNVLNLSQTERDDIFLK
jgi:DNA-binding phage protein